VRLSAAIDHAQGLCVARPRTAAPSRRAGARAGTAHNRRAAREGHLCVADRFAWRRKVAPTSHRWWHDAFGVRQSLAYDFFRFVRQPLMGQSSGFQELRGGADRANQFGTLRPDRQAPFDCAGPSGCATGHPSPPRTFGSPRPSCARLCHVAYACAQTLTVT
jgi:hypothetical protein